MDSLDRDTPSSQLSASPQVPDSADSKQQLLSLGIDQPIPEFNIQLSDWNALEWETKAAGASLPYTPSYASFNSPGSNISALSGPYDDADLDYSNSAANVAATRAYITNMDGDEQYNPLDYGTGNADFQLLEDQFGNPDEYLSNPSTQSNPRLHITDPQGSQSQSSYASQFTAGYRATPEHSPSPASSAGEIEQQSYTHGGSGIPYQPSPMLGNIAPPAGFSEGLANLNFGGQMHNGAHSPPEGYYQQTSRVPTPINVPSNDTPSPQHPSAGASSPGTPGSVTAAQRPVIITDSLSSLSSPPLGASSTDVTSNGYLQPQQPSSGSDAPDIMLIPSSPAGLGPADAQQASLQSQPAQSAAVNNETPAQQQPQRPPGLHDFLSSAPSAGASNPWSPGHRPRSASHSDIVRLNQSMQGGMAAPSYGPALLPGPNSLFANTATMGSSGNVMGAPRPLGQGSWQDTSMFNSYPYAAQQQATRTVNPNEAFGNANQQSTAADTSVLDSLLTMPASPDHHSTALPGPMHQPGMPTFNSAPTLSVTHHVNSSAMAPAHSSPGFGAGSQQHSPAGSYSSLSTAGPSNYFQTQQTLAPVNDWNNGPANLRRLKTTGSMISHRRGVHSEDITSSWGRRDALGSLSTEQFLQTIKSPDGSLAPPSTSSTPAGGHPGAPMYSTTPDSLGLGLGQYTTSSESSYGGDEGDYFGGGGGPGPTRGRRRGSSAASDRSPYSRPLSISPSRSPRYPQPDLYSPNNNVAAETVPANAVERQHVTTPATELASQNRRKNKAAFVCPVEGCGSTFTRQFNLKGHLRSHREERPYVCKWPNCGKGFARQHDCKRHEALHLNIRPFTCDGCGKTFARMDALNRHHKSDGGVDCRHTATDLDGNGNGMGGSNDAYLGDASYARQQYIA